MTSLFVAGVDPSEIAMTSIVGTFAIVIAAIAFGTMASVAKSRQREQTKREIAAYVAEGSISPKDAAVLLTAEPDRIRQQVADGLACGMISAKGAERLLKATDAKLMVS